MRALFWCLIAALAAGCAMPGQRPPEAYTHSEVLSHDFTNGDPRDAPFAVNVSSQLTYQIAFLGIPAPAGQGWVCPLEGSGILVELAAPDGTVAASLEPDVRGVTGAEDCGQEDGAIADAAAGSWVVRFRGEGRATAVLTLVAVGYPG